MAAPSSSTEANIQRLMTHERIRNARLLAGFRVAGVSAMFALSLVQALALHRPDWQAPLSVFTVYWLGALLVAFIAFRKSDVARLAGLGLLVVDVPLVFWIQSIALPLSPFPAGVAGFSLGVFGVFVLLACFSL